MREDGAIVSGVDKRFLREVFPDKDVGNSKSSSWPRRKKLSDMLGPQWSKKDLGRFYEAYRKHGRDWRKVSATLRDRTADMVEALYNMNRAYLSLPEEISSAGGLIAMMTDHYGSEWTLCLKNQQEGSDDGEETNYDRMEGRSAQKRKRSKVQPKEDTVNLRTESSNEDCLSLLKRRRVDGGQLRAVGKRTPRVPVSYLYKDNSSPTSRRGQKLEVEGNDDDIAHRAALFLSAASQKGSSPQISQHSFSKPEHVKASPVQSHERMHLQSRVTKHGDVLGDEEWNEGSMERGAENGDYIKGDSSGSQPSADPADVILQSVGKNIASSLDKVSRAIIESAEILANKMPCPYNLNEKLFTSLQALDLSEEYLIECYYFLAMHEAIANKFLGIPQQFRKVMLTRIMKSTS